MVIWGRSMAGLGLELLSSIISQGFFFSVLWFYEHEFELSAMHCMETSYSCKRASILSGACGCGITIKRSFSSGTKVPKKGFVKGWLFAESKRTSSSITICMAYRIQINLAITTLSLSRVVSSQGLNRLDTPNPLTIFYSLAS